MFQLSRLKKLLKRSRRRWFEFWGSDRYSKPGKEGLDQKLAKYLPDQGFFIEVGANDGFLRATHIIWSGLRIGR